MSAEHDAREAPDAQHIVPPSSQPQNLRTTASVPLACSLTIFIPHTPSDHRIVRPPVPTASPNLDQAVHTHVFTPGGVHKRGETSRRTRVSDVTLTPSGWDEVDCVTWQTYFGKKLRRSSMGHGIHERHGRRRPSCLWA